MAPDTPLYFSYTICTVLYYIYFICTVFVVFVPQFTTGVLPPYHCFILYLYHSLYFICTVFVSPLCTIFVPQFVLYLYYICITIHHRSPISLSVGRCRRFLSGWYCSVHSLTAIRHFIYTLPVGSWKYRDGTTCTVSCRSESGNISLVVLAVK